MTEEGSGRVESASTDYRSIEIDVHRARRGDGEAFRRLLERCRDSVASTLYVCGVRSSAEAEDVTQEIALKAWTALPKLRNARAFPAWLRRIAANAARDSVRSRPPLSISTDDPSVVDGLESRESPDDRLLRLGEVEGRVTAFRQLDPEVREILLARAAGSSYREISERVGLSVEAVRMRVMRARRRLREYLDSPSDRSRDT